MRFLPAGPSIPDDLLLARDQGRVIFFCGAGVSRARANLPDFFGLAEKVITTLGVVPESAAFKLIREAQEIDQRIGVSGLISADRVFGLLERDFLHRDIESAVASALKPTPDRDLSAHNTLLDLATTPEGAVRLVTTNFDRLFDDCGRNLQTWQQPRLPDPSRHAEMNGIVYLHGKATSDYNGAEGDGFVLSSSEFGRAYLSDGWATSFVREIMKRYVVVFVGYTADDPPVQYLLEALNKTSGSLDGAYAFQSGGPNDASARWRHKGVEAIAYNADNGHSALWTTLECWAQRAKNADLWYSNVIQLAKRGPEALLAHERGQIAHVVSTYEGVKKFSEGDDPPPAEWLCVFDPYRRYYRPGHLRNFEERGPYVDPFELYGIDSDAPPSKIDPEDQYAKRELPPNAWDGFALNRLDRQNLRDENLPSIRGHWAANAPRLTPRLHQMGVWITKVANQPAAVWWAAHQTSLHNDIQSQIRWELERSGHISTQKIRQAWRFLLETWKQKTDELSNEWYELQALVAKDGWDNGFVRQHADIRRPRFGAGPNYWSGPKPPANDSDLDVHKLVRREVKYPERYEETIIPDPWVSPITKALRQNLELAISLENEIGGYGLINIGPIIPEEDRDHDGYERTHGLSGIISEFVSLFSRLIDLDIVCARNELNAWPVIDDTIFARLRIWVAGSNKLISAANFGSVIDQISDIAFWHSQHQRDLLLVLRDRWKDLDEKTRTVIQSRLLSGPTRLFEEEDDQFDERQAWSILDRIHWMSNQGCKFSFDPEKVSEPLRARAPRWQPKYADNAAESLEGRGGVVKTVTEHSDLLTVPVSLILSRAIELSGRTEDFLVEKDPYAGLAAERPVRAFSALTNAGKRDDFPEWAWQTFLNSESRKNDTSRFVGLIAERLATYSDSVLINLVRPAANWLLSVSKVLAVQYPASFDKIVKKIVGVLRLQPNIGNSAIIRGTREPDWTMEAINSPLGKIAQALFNDPRKNDLKTGGRFPASWLTYVETLLVLEGDLRRYAIVIFFHNLNWFYAVDPDWAEKNLLSVLDSKDEYDKGAAWAGILWGSGIPNQKLYMRLKSDLMTLAMKPSPSRRGYGEVLAGLILAGWGSIEEATGNRCISNEEMRTLLLHVGDDFRSRILWQAEHWSNSIDASVGERWAGLLPELLQKAWPRQISAKSPTISARLCDLAFSNAKQFLKLADIVMPLLTKIDQDQLRLPNLRRSKDSIVDLYPEKALALLDAVLPDNARSWPYGIDGTLRRIGEVDRSLENDERMIALKRKWNAR